MVTGIISLEGQAWEDESVSVIRPTSDMYYEEVTDVLLCLTQSKIARDCPKLTTDFESWCEKLEPGKRIESCRIQNLNGDSFYISVNYKFGHRLSFDVNQTFKINKKLWTELHEKN